MVGYINWLELLRSRFTTEAAESGEAGATAMYTDMVFELGKVTSWSPEPSVVAAARQLSGKACFPNSYFRVTALTWSSESH